MESVTLKKNYLYVAIVFFSLIILGSLFLYNWNELYTIPKQRSKADLLITLACISFFLSIYKPYKYLKNPEICITKSTIQFDSDVYDITSITELLLTGKRNTTLLNQPVDAIKIVFNDDVIRFIDCWKYVNINQAKLFLEEIFYQKDSISDDKKHLSLLKKLESATNFLYFKGSFLFSSHGILFIVFEIAALYLATIPSVKDSLILTIFFALGIYIFTAIQIFYIGINNQQLIIKNYLLPWAKTTYWLSDIKEIKFKSNFRAPFSITITDLNYKDKKYFCGTLRYYEWKNLKVKLEELEIEVKNELNI